MAVAPAGFRWYRKTLVFILSLVSLAVLLGLTELVLRRGGYQVKNRVTIDVRNPNDARFYHLFEDSGAMYDPVTIWRPRPGGRLFNAQGFRGPDLTTIEGPGFYRVFVFGDSNVVGRISKFANWPGSLQVILGNVDPSLIVINGGVDGYATYQGYGRFLESLQYRPNMVLFSFGANDAHQVSVPDSEFIEKALTWRRLRQFLHHFLLGKWFLTNYTEHFTPPPGQLQARVGLEEYRQILINLIRTGRSKGVVVVLLTRPYIGVSSDPGCWKYYAPLYREATREVAAKESVLLVDLYSFFRNKEEYFANEAHLTSRGHRLAAQKVFEAIRPLLPVRTTMSTAEQTPKLKTGRRARRRRGKSNVP